METFIKLFLPNSIDKDIKKTVKQRVLVIFLLFTIIGSFATIPIYVYYQSYNLLNTLLFSIISCTSIIIYYKISSNFKISTLLYISYSFLYFFLMSIFTGGINSSLLIWFVLFPILVINLDGSLVKFTLTGFLIVLIALFLFDYFDITFINEIEELIGKYFKFSTQISFSLIIILLFYYNDDVNKNKYEKLKKSNTELEKFAYVASHDMKTPIRNIMNFTQLIQKDNKDKLDAKTENYLEYIMDNGYQMNELIQSILEILKIDKQELLEKKTIDLNKIVNKIKKKIITDDKNLITQLTTLPSILADESQILQVFFHIIENGLKYNKSESPEVKISHKEDKDFVHFYFEDNGIGIAPEYFDKIFEMFKRLHSNFEYKGTGIGLAICMKIISRHEGNLIIESSNKEGTIFKLSLKK